MLHFARKIKGSKELKKMSELKPGMHKSIPMGTKVIVPETYGLGKKVSGRVAGIASFHIIFHYIIILDKPIKAYNETWEAVVVPGTELESIDGKNWKLEK